MTEISVQKNFDGINAGLQHIEAEKNGHHLPDDIFRCIFVDENVCILISIRYSGQE